MNILLKQYEKEVSLPGDGTRDPHHLDVLLQSPQGDFLPALASSTVFPECLFLVEVPLSCPGEEPRDAQGSKSTKGIRSRERYRCPLSGQSNYFLIPCNPAWSVTYCRVTLVF